MRDCIKDGKGNYPYLLLWHLSSGFSLVIIPVEPFAAFIKTIIPGVHIHKHQVGYELPVLRYKDFNVVVR